MSDAPQSFGPHLRAVREPGAPTALAEALGPIRVSAEGASLLARQSALAADLHDEDGRYCGAVDAGGVVVWRDGP